ncbi:MAG: hypothetical protein J7L57_01525 [Deltaproteobacteria bacterium]|nr:hypothetical protein [Candidatus Tharpella sp.]
MRPKKVVAGELRADLIISSYNKMGCDAINIGAYDLSLGVDYLLKKEKSANFPFLSGNILDKHDKYIFTPSIIKSVNGIKVGILGLCDDKLKLKKIPGHDKFKIVNPMEKAEEITAHLKKEGVDYVVLLTNLKISSCRRLAQHGIPIDLIVGISKKSRISLPILVKETYIAHVERGGKRVGRLDVSFLDTTGVESLPLATRMKGKTVGEKLFLLNHFFPLLKTIPDHPEIGSMVEAVENELSRLQKANVEAELSVLQQVSATSSIAMGELANKQENSYVFAKACAQCHPGHYQRWLKTPHARAYHSLVEHEKHFDEDCVRCHTVGYREKGGFFDVSQAGHYANVQCESCHGPGRLHVAAKGQLKTVKEPSGVKICLDCHIEERSPEFNRETYFHNVCGCVDCKD